MILLGIVDDVFHISGRGSAVSFDFAESLDPSLQFRVTEEIRLQTPGGVTMDTKS